MGVRRGVRGGELGGANERLFCACRALFESKGSRHSVRTPVEVSRTRGRRPRVPADRRGGSEASGAIAPPELVHTIAAAREIVAANEEVEVPESTVSSSFLRSRCQGQGCRRHGTLDGRSAHPSPFQSPASAVRALTVLAAGPLVAATRFPFPSDSQSWFEKKKLFIESLVVPMKRSTWPGGWRRGRA